MLTKDRAKEYLKSAKQFWVVNNTLAKHLHLRAYAEVVIYLGQTFEVLTFEEREALSEELASLPEPYPNLPSTLVIPANEFPVDVLAIMEKDALFVAQDFWLAIETQVIKVLTSEDLDRLISNPSFAKKLLEANSKTYGKQALLQDSLRRAQDRLFELQDTAYNSRDDDMNFE